MTREYIIYCDESEKKGARYSNFYGGALVRYDDINRIIDILEQKKHELNLHNEVKWQKVTSNYLSKYCSLIDEFFKFVRKDKIKVRIMFTDNNFQVQNLQSYHREHEYFLLYYQFIKHAFGLRYANKSKKYIKVRIYFDKLPDTKEKNERFKDFVHRINLWPEFRKGKIDIQRDQLAEVTSHKHVVLQCLDIVLGSMQFRLNNKNEVKPKGAKCRSKKTIAKEKLYKHINKNIRELYPYFNIGISTGIHGDITNRWKHPYRHWLFKAENAEYKAQE